MRNNDGHRTWAVLLLAVFLAGCAADMQPYIYITGEFDRTREDFGQEPEDINQAIVCYNKYKTKPETVRNMAVVRCAKYDKQAIFQRQDLHLCPLMTPIAAYYRCYGEKDRQKEQEAKEKEEQEKRENPRSR